MAEESDTGSIQSSISDQSNDKKQTELKRYYALYTFYPNRPRSTSDPSTSEGGDSVEDGNLSLSIAATNLSASAETDLRKSVAQRLSRIPSPSGIGNFLSLGISSFEDVTSSAACYFNVLDTTASVPDESKATNLRKFVVCFISFSESSLDQFRHDLDQYSNGLIHLLDQEPLPQDNKHMGDIHWQLSQLNTGVKIYLESWPEIVLEYLTRCIARLGDGLQHLIHCALIDATLQITGGTPQDEEDIKRFINCCGFASLLEQLQTSDQQTAGIGLSGETWQIQPSIVSLNLTEHQAVFDMHGINPCSFCKLAADRLVSIDAKNVTGIKEIMESIKIEFSQNLNGFKRFLKQAERDHYALYSAFVFLKQSGCGKLLLRYVKLDASPETLCVLNALEQFIQDKRILIL